MTAKLEEAKAPQGSRRNRQTPGAARHRKAAQGRDRGRNARYFQEIRSATAACCPEMVPVPRRRVHDGIEQGGYRQRSIAASNEGPQRKVVIRQPLAVGRFEVTRDQFEAFVRASGHKVGDKCWTLEGNEPKERDGRSFRNPGYAQTRHASRRVRELGGRQGLRRLAVEDHRQGLSAAVGSAVGICRQGRKRRGAIPADSTEADLCAFGNGADQTASAAKLPADWEYLRCSDGYVHTAPVGSFKANAFGLFDLMGNAWEWMEDCYADNLAGRPADGQACALPAIAGSTPSAAAPGRRPRACCGLAVRGKAPADSRFDDVGFRVRRTLFCRAMNPLGSKFDP